MSALKLLAIGAAGYVLYETGLLSSLTGGLIPPPVGSAPAGTSTPTNPTTPTPSVNTKALVLSSALQANPTMLPTALNTFDAWNYFYGQVRGIPGPDPGLFTPSYQAGQKISIDEWWNYVSSKGFSGLFPGFGMIARRGLMGMSRGLRGCACGCGPSNPFNPSPGMGRFIY